MCKQLVSPLEQLPKQVLQLNIVYFGLQLHSVRDLAAVLDQREGRGEPGRPAGRGHLGECKLV